MLLTELVEIVLTESGEFILESLDNITINFDLARFWRMTKTELRKYSSHVPVTHRYNITTSGWNYTFDDANSPHGVPLWISECVPVTIMTNLNQILQYQPNGVFGLNSTSNPRPFSWDYEKPTLRTTEDGMMDVLTVHRHTVEETKDGGGVLTEVDLIDITEEDHHFIALVNAKFLIALGRSRRAFTLNELPTVMDAAELVSEGEQKYNETMEHLEEVNSWYLGVPV